jgi:hypothetical protein
VRTALLAAGLTADANGQSAEAIDHAMPLALAPDVPPASATRAADIERGSAPRNHAGEVEARKADRSPPPVPAETGRPGANPELEGERREPEAVVPRVETETSGPVRRKEARQADPGSDAWSFSPELHPDEHGALPWIDRRLLDLSRRLERRIHLDPELRGFGDAESLGYGAQDERQQQELSQRLFDTVRSGFTAMARDELDPLRAEVSEMFLDEPFIRMFSLDSAYRHSAEERGLTADAGVGDGAASLTVVRWSRSPVQRGVQTLADWTSRAVPGELDFKASVSVRRLKLGAALRPWADVDVPAPLRGFTIRASREYEEYLSGLDVVDRFDCSIALFVSPESSGRLFLENRRGGREEATRLGFSWVCRF